MSQPAILLFRRFRYSWISTILWMVITVGIAYSIVPNLLLRRALQKESVDSALLALRLGAKPDSPYEGPYGEGPKVEGGTTCFIRAAELDSPKAIPLVREMLRRGGDPNFDYGWYGARSVWETAIAANDVAMVRMLKAERASLAISEPSVESVIESLDSLSPEMLELLRSQGLALGGSINGQGILHHAAKKGKLPIVMYLVEQRVPIDTHDSDLMTPLMLAIDAYQVDTVHYLLEHGANHHHRDSEHASVMDHARAIRATSYSPETQAQAKRIIDLLRQQGAR